MGIYMPNMEMPKTCVQCDLKIYDPEIRWDENGNEQIGAWVCKRTREIIWNTQRGENCPLVPLPEGHGRLVDAERFRVILCRLKERQNDDVATHALNWAIECLDKMDTIVPAEGGDNNEHV